jgi:hypothetical protein
LNLKVIARQPTSQGLLKTLLNFAQIDWGDILRWWGDLYHIFRRITVQDCFVRNDDGVGFAMAGGR